MRETRLKSGLENKNYSTLDLGTCWECGGCFELDNKKIPKQMLIGYMEEYLWEMHGMFVRTLVSGVLKNFTESRYNQLERVIQEADSREAKEN